MTQTAPKSYSYTEARYNYIAIPESAGRRAHLLLQLSDELYSLGLCVGVGCWFSQDRQNANRFAFLGVRDWKRVKDSFVSYLRTQVQEIEALIAQGKHDKAWEKSTCNYVCEQVRYMLTQLTQC